jgi:hypothetical protein
MGGYVYCIYSTEDGVPRYVGCVEDKVSYRFRQHVTAALDKEPGQLYDWIRDVWRGDFDVAVFTLQEGIIPKDHAMFEQYWIDQFANLLSASNRPGKQHSTVAKQIIESIRGQIERARQDN